jgi:hypothetical protein
LLRRIYSSAHSSHILMSVLEEVTVTFQKVSQESRVGMRLADGEGGTVVEEINESGPAARAGVRKGDAIMSVNEVAVRDHEQGAGLVIAAEGAVELRLVRGFAAPAPGPGITSDALGSGETLESLGVDLSAVLAQQRDVDTEHALLEVVIPATLVDKSGANAHALRCQFCGCCILSAGKVSHLPTMAFTMPPMPRVRSAVAPGTISSAPAEEVVGFWRARDKFDFDNVTVTKAAAEGGFRFLSCAECELGPFGFFSDDKVGDELGVAVDFFVAAGRVRYA